MSLLNESCCNRILVNVCQFIPEITCAPANEIKIAALPDGSAQLPLFRQSESGLRLEIAHDTHK